MALTQSQKWLAVGGLALGAAYLGYTTLFPQTESVYADTPHDAVESIVVTDAPLEQALSSATLEPVQHELLLERALSKELAAQLAPPTERTKPLELDEQALEYLTKSRDVTLAELDAKLREQNARAQPSAITGLGLNAPMAPTSVSTPAVSSSSPSKPVLPVSLGSVVQLTNGAYFARLHYQGRWHKLTKGARVGDLSVISISDSGVKVQLGKQRYHLLPGGGYE